MKQANAGILTVNSGSSSIKFAFFEFGEFPKRSFWGELRRIGISDSTLQVNGLDDADNFSKRVTSPDYTVATQTLIDWIEERCERDSITAIGHRIVHGGTKYSKPTLISS